MLGKVKDPSPARRRRPDKPSRQRAKPDARFRERGGQRLPGAGPAGASFGKRRAELPSPAGRRGPAAGER